MNTKHFLIKVGFAIVTHLAIAILFLSIGQQSGYSQGVRDGHLAVRATVNERTKQLCSYSPRDCDGALLVQFALHDQFPNAGRVERDHHAATRNYLLN